MVAVSLKKKKEEGGARSGDEEREDKEMRGDAGWCKGSDEGLAARRRVGSEGTRNREDRMVSAVQRSGDASDAGAHERGGRGRRSRAQGGRGLR